MGKHTRPDYSTKQKMATIYGEVDNAELAARLNSVDTYDRRGNVILIEDFEAATLKWVTSTVGVGAAANLSAAWAKRGSTSCILTAGAGAAGNAQIARYVPVLNAGKIGGEISFTIDPDTTLIYFVIAYYDGANTYQAYMMYDHANTRLRYRAAGGAFVTLVDPLILDDQYNIFHSIKVVLDINLMEYVRVIVDNTQTSMAGIQSYNLISAFNPIIIYWVHHASDNAAAKSIYVDDFILTQNEP